MNHYQVLGVDPQCEDIVIRAAYRALMQRYHPDKLSESQRDSATERMLLISKAYSVLSDASLRTEYDAQLGISSQKKTAKSNPSAFSMASVQSASINGRLIDPQWINSMEVASWQTLLTRYPQFANGFSELERSEPHLAKEYKDLLLELISEKMVERMVGRITSEIHNTRTVSEAGDLSKDSQESKS
jgi:DnaJ-class molecular chaperone